MDSCFLTKLRLSPEICKSHLADSTHIYSIIEPVKSKKRGLASIFYRFRASGTCFYLSLQQSNKKKLQEKTKRAKAPKTKRNEENRGTGYN